MRYYVIAAGFAGYDAPRAVFPSFVHVRGGSTDAVLGPGAMPVVVASSALLCSFHWCNSWTWSFKFPVVVQRPIPIVFCSEDHKYSLVAQPR